MVIDHPHVGEAAEAECLAPFQGDLAQFKLGSIGGSFESYCWHGKQWALPIDAAAQVQAWMPGRRSNPVEHWSQLAEVAAAGELALPLRAPHALMSLFSLCGLLAVTLTPSEQDLFPPGAIQAYEILAHLACVLDSSMFDMDPIAVLEEMAGSGSRLSVVPLIYGYVSYAKDGFRDQIVRFADIPVVAEDAPRGSTLGGTGIAISALRGNVAEAESFARWVASGSVQANLFANNGGQPAHRDAWESEHLNEVTGDFYRSTRRTLDLAWIRPRHRGYMAFQHQASVRLEQALRGGEAGETLIHDLNALYRSTHEAQIQPQ
ncbi:MAG: carbohydrate ABC transporter substrate-binding protein [Sphingomonadaceae bacterium]